MSRLRRIVLVRHAETDGNSSTRFHGANDVDLSPEGEAQMREVGRGFGHEHFDLVMASPLRRSWRAARLAGRGAPVRIEADFREIDFGRWEGLTREEIQATDPVLYEDWQSRAAGFEFPNGEPRAAFRERVGRGLDRLLASGAGSALVVVHKGVVRAIHQRLTGEELPGDEVPLGAVIELAVAGKGWARGRPGSNPEGVDYEVSLEIEAPR
jgi:broad specificity phosphatase PhoE